MGGPVAYYQLRYRLVDDDGPWTYLRLERDATSVRLDKLERGKQYVIEARSVGPTGLKSIWLNQQHQVATLAAPGSPTALTARAVLNGVSLHWTMPDGTPATTAYQIERAPDVAGAPGAFALVGLATAGASWVDVPSGEGIYHWRVRAVNHQGAFSAAYSNTVVLDITSEAEVEAQINTALTTAQNAQATADGKITSFWQTTPPVIGPNDAQEGDIWFDTDDGNKVYRVVAGAWAVAADDDMAQAIQLASDAQATADGKVKTYFQATAPTASAVGDLWFNTVTSKLLRWNGSAWNQDVADITLDQLGGTGVNLLPDQYSTYERTTLPPFNGTNLITLSRDATAHVVGSGSLKMAPTGADAYAYFGSGFNIQASPGKKYIVSAYVRSINALSGLFYLRDAANNHYVGAWTSTAGSVFTRVSAVVDCAGSTGTVLQLRVNNNGGVGNDMLIDGIMVEEQIGTKTEPSTYSRGTPASVAVEAIGAAAAAQSTADGKIVTFYQSTTPTGGTLGDLWFHTGEGDKLYRHNGTSWVESQDNAIAQAINDAAGAQATADGKVTTFYAASAPTPEAVGDLWYDTGGKILYRWNGSAWILVSELASATASVAVMNPSFEQGLLHWSPNGGDGFYTSTTTGFAIDGSTVLVKFGGSQNCELFNSGGQLAVGPDGRVRAYARVRHDGGAGLGTFRIIVYCYNSAGMYITQADLVTATGASFAANTWKYLQGQYTPPANTVYVRVGLGFFSWTGAGAWFMDTVGLEHVPVSVDEVPDGVTYGRPSWNDLYSSGGVNRIGLRIGGSGHRIGGQNNLVQALTTAYGAVRTTTALSADSSGNVSVNAHTIRYGGFSVSYNAVTNAVTGLAQSTKYVIYCYDDGFDGGTRTWYAGTSRDAVMNLGNGVVIAGEITIPTSGSSGGGGGGGFDDCVAEDMVFADGLPVSEAELGQMVACWDGEGTLGANMAEVEGARRVPNTPCVKLVTESGAEVVTSVSTPMTLQDGRNVFVSDMQGELALVQDDHGRLRWERVVRAEFVGRRTVVRLNVGGQSYFAGKNQRLTIATHNTIKP